jgi:hypothetical protein
MAMRAWIGRWLIDFGTSLIGWGADMLGKPRTVPADPERDERERLENDRLYLAAVEREVVATIKREREGNAR